MSLTNPYPSLFVPDQRWWEVYSERFRQADALYRIGEWAIFQLRWTVRDFDAGLCTRCPNCVTNESMVNQTYQQPSYENCPVCYGSLYVGDHGGIKALLARPTIWMFGEENLTWLPRGELEIQNATVTTTGDFRCFNRDLIFRGDGQRFSITGVQGLHLSNGFGTQSHTNTMVSGTYQVARENQSAPAYMIAPSTDDLVSLLNTPYQRQVMNFSATEFVDGPISL